MAIVKQTKSLLEPSTASLRSLRSSPGRKGLKLATQRSALMAKKGYVLISVSVSSEQWGC